ncbi:MAG: hypothetical protein EBT20_23020 [Alphaproteobacteria bacterium]|nr:hypothetical protein [Alphaproteobacteria bacterium]
MNNLFPAMMLFALLVFPQNLSAQSATHCPMTANDANCVRVVACIGNEGAWFNGRAFGRGEGTFSGTTSTDLMCERTWMSCNAFGLAQTDVMCEDGSKGRVFYTYQDEYTGTAVGQGAMHSGEKIKIWSGTNVLEYLRGDTGEHIAYLPCDGGAILMG